MIDETVLACIILIAIIMIVVSAGFNIYKSNTYEYELLKACNGNVECMSGVSSSWHGSNK